MLRSFATLWYEAESDKKNKKIFDSLDDCFINGKCKNTMNILLDADKNNCKIAASFIGNFYANGKHNTTKDINKAIYWHVKAFFKNGDIDAGLDLAILYKNSAIEKKDNALYKKSVEIYQKLSAINNHIALNALGEYHELGLGVDKNIDKAIDYYQRAAEHGNLVSDVSFCRLYRKHKNWFKGAKMCLKSVLKYLYETIKNSKSEKLRRQ